MSDNLDTFTAPEWLPATDAPVFAILAASGDGDAVAVYLATHTANPDNRSGGNVPRAAVADRLAAIAGAVLANRIADGNAAVKSDGTTYTSYPAAWRGVNVPATVRLNPRDVAAGKVTAAMFGGGIPALAAAMTFAIGDVADEDAAAVADAVATVTAAMHDNRAVAAVTAIGKGYHCSGYGSTRPKR